MGLYFLIEEGVFPSFQRQKKNLFTVTAPVYQLKVRFTFLQKSDYIGKASVLNSWIARMRKSEL